jgi:hypothetical protein
MPPDLPAFLGGRSTPHRMDMKRSIDPARGRADDSR